LIECIVSDYSYLDEEWMENNKCIHIIYKKKSRGKHKWAYCKVKKCFLMDIKTCAIAGCREWRLI
jgi:hypothetical protein